MKRYAALTRKRHRITSVFAVSSEIARRKIAEELDRPGRRAYYQQWVQDGQLIGEVGGPDGKSDLAG